jgi:hypothetical protein
MRDLLNQFKISLRANNQVTLTRQRLAGKKERRYEKPSQSKLSQDEINSLILRDATNTGLDTVKKFYDSKRRTVVKSMANAGLVSRSLLLDITNKFQHGTNAAIQSRADTKAGYGNPPRIKSFSAKAGQKVRECGAAIDYLCNGEPSRCRVITLTLPATGDEAYKALSNWSGYATNRLLQLIRRTKDDSYHWFYVWEHQKRGALHMHLCLYNEQCSESEKLGDAIVSKWRDILRDIGTRCGIDLLFSKGFNRRVESHEMQSNNQQMRKGCGAYFSKYAAKTSNTRDKSGTQTVNTRNACLYPASSYWGRSQNLARLCKSLSFGWKFEGVDGTDSETLLHEALEILSQKDIVLQYDFHFKKEIIIPENGSLTIVEGLSHVFYVSPSDYQELLAHFKFVFGDRHSSSIPERAKRKGGGEVCAIDGYF